MALVRFFLQLAILHILLRGRQHAFRDVQDLLGQQSHGTRASKAQVLQGAAEHIGQLEAESSGLVEEIAQLKGEISALKLSVRCAGAASGGGYGGYTSTPLDPQPNAE